MTHNNMNGNAGASLPEQLSLLLVDDSADDSFFFRRMLNKSGVSCQFRHLGDGGAAIDFLEAAIRPDTKTPGLPDVIFLDLKMPVLSGFDVLRWLKERALERAPRVVVLSGSDEAADQRKARELGAADFLVKPITKEILALKLREHAAQPPLQPGKKDLAEAANEGNR